MGLNAVLEKLYGNLTLVTLASCIESCTAYRLQVELQGYTQFLVQGHLLRLL